MNQTVSRAMLGALAIAMLAGCAASQQASERADAAPYRAEIRRTQSGIPHIRAADWGSLGYGYGYAQAQDNLCSLADGFVTWRGERSEHFGADARPPNPSIFGEPRNL